MNLNDYGSLQNKKSATDSGLYGNGSVSCRPQQPQMYAYDANIARANGSASSYGNMQTGNRSNHQANPNGSAQNYNSANRYASSGQPQAQNPAQSNFDTYAGANGGAKSYRTNYGAANVNGNSTAARGYGNGSSNGSSNGSANGSGEKANGNGSANGSANGSGAKSNGSGSSSVNGSANGSGKKSSGSGNGSGNGLRGGSGNGSGSNGNGGSSGKKSAKKKSFKQNFLAWLKKFLRSIYLMSKPMRIFLASATGFVLLCIIVIFSVSGARQKRAEAISAELALSTPVPTIEATATPEPTPSPTPEIRIEKGAEGEDVMALQKRLMELGYLAIDEPTSYFGAATKAALKLFQRQHDLQQDGICGNETIAQIYSDDAKPYVMLEGEEGDDIESFQEQLVELGYLESNQVTGYYGTDTVDAVKEFQRRNYLTKDGKAGEKTLEAINSPDARVSYVKEQEIIAEKKKQAALARASSAEGRIDKMISIAKKQLGDTYILGKSGPDSFDCSGLVYYCLRQVNVYTRRLNAAGLSRTTSWTKITSLSDVKKGDLLFFKSDDSSTIGHVGIYIGGGEMIDASSANGKVVRRSAKSSYWRRNFVVARRPIE